MSKQIKIIVELTIDDATVSLDDATIGLIKKNVEEALGLNCFALARYCHTLGIYHDAEVVEVCETKVYDARQ